MYLVGLEETANFTSCVCVCAWVCICVCVCLHKCPLIIHTRGRHYCQPPFRDGAWDSEKWRTFQGTDSVRLLSLVPVIPRTSRACLIQQWNWAWPQLRKGLFSLWVLFLISVLKVEHLGAQSWTQQITGEVWEGYTKPSDRTLWMVTKGPWAEVGEVWKADKIWL